MDRINIIDQQELMEHLEGDWELLEETVELYREEMPVMQADLRAALESNDLESVRSHAHGIKGTLANFLAEAACQTAAKIEELASREELAVTATLVDQLSNQLNAVQSELLQILESAPR